MALSVPAALLDAMRAAGAVYDPSTEDAGPAHFGDPLAEYRAVRERAGLLWRSERGVIEVGGTERAPWLQGMVTNDVTLLDRGAPSVAACLLNATGHVIADFVIVPRGDTLLLDTPRAALPAAATALDRLIIMEDVTLRDASAGIICLSVQGPGADEATVRAAAGPDATVVPADHTVSGGFDCYVASDDAALVWNRLTMAGITPVGREVAETIRVEAGIPRFGAELDDAVIPLEAGLEVTHISYEKGCYLGQEIVARIHSRGHTNRALTGLLLSGAQVPNLRAKVLDPADDGREVGWVTSAVISPALGRPIALAYVRHEARDVGTLLRVESAGGALAATVAPLPLGRSPS